MPVNGSIGHIIFWRTFKAIVYSVTNRLMIKRKLKLKLNLNVPTFRF